MEPFTKEEEMIVSLCLAFCYIDSGNQTTALEKSKIKSLMDYLDSLDGKEFVNSISKTFKRLVMEGKLHDHTIDSE